VDVEPEKEEDEAASQVEEAKPSALASSSSAPFKRRKSVTFKEQVVVITDTTREVEELSTRQGKPKRRLKPNASWYFKCGTSKQLRAVPEKRKLVIPTVYVVCRLGDNDTRITRKMVESQNWWANQAYSGSSPFQRMDFDKGTPSAVDMQIQFKLVDVKFVTDKRCAREGFMDDAHAQKYNQKPGKQLTVVVITDDESGILGQSQFPQDASEDSPEQLVMISAAGFRKFSSKQKLDDVTYDEGDGRARGRALAGPVPHLRGRLRLGRRRLGGRHVVRGVPALRLRRVEVLQQERARSGAQLHGLLA